MLAATGKTCCHFVVLQPPAQPPACLSHVQIFVQVKPGPCFAQPGSLYREQQPWQAHFAALAAQPGGIAAVQSSDQMRIRSWQPPAALSAARRPVSPSGVWLHSSLSGVEHALSAALQVSADAKDAWQSFSPQAVTVLARSGNALHNDAGISVPAGLRESPITLHKGPGGAVKEPCHSARLDHSLEHLKQKKS